MINVLFLTETWWKDYAQYTQVGCFKPVARKDRVKGPRGGVAILFRTTCSFLANEIDLDDFDFAVAIALCLSEKTMALIILVSLPYPSPHEVSVECMATLLLNSYSFHGTKVSLECLLSFIICSRQF